MEEINDLTRIISVTLEGMRLGVIASKESLKIMGRLVKSIYCALKYDRVRSGQVKSFNPVKKLKKMDQNISFVKVNEKNLKKFQKLAKKYGIYYTKMPSYSTASDKGMVHIMYHTSAAASMESVLETLRKQNIDEMDGKMDEKETIEDYMKRSGMEALSDEQFLRELKEKYPKQFSELDNLVSNAKKNEVKEKLVKEALADNSRLEKKQSKDNSIIYIGKNQVIKETRDEVMIRTRKADESYLWIEKKDLYDQNKDVVMGIVPNDKDLRLTNFDETEHFSIKGSDMKHYIDSRYEPITITKQNIIQETESRYMTRIPASHGKECLWIDKLNASDEHNGKSIKTFLDKESSYIIVDADNNFVKTISGSQLYAGHYDPFKENVNKVMKSVGKKIQHKAPAIS